MQYVGRTTRLPLSTEVKKIAMKKLVDLLTMAINFIEDQVYSEDGDSVVLVPFEVFQMIAKFNEDMLEVKESISIVHPTAGGEQNENGDVPRTPPRSAVRSEATKANAVIRSDNQALLRIKESEVGN